MTAGTLTVRRTCAPIPRITDANVKRVRTRRAALIPGTTIDAFAAPKHLIAAADEVLGIASMARGAGLTTLDGDDTYPIAHAAALRITSNTDSTVTTKFGMNSTPEDRMRIRQFEQVRQNVTERLAHCRRLLGSNDFNGRIAYAKER